MKAISAATARLDRQRKVLAFTVTVFPLLGSIAAVALWFQGTGPGFVGLGALFVMYVITMFGLEVGYHRHLTHRSFVAKPALRSALAIFGSMGFEGPPLWWTAVHRRHHSYSDTEGDPHSPNLAGKGFAGLVKGLFHAHFGWMYTSTSTGRALVENFPRDLSRDKPILWINKHYFHWVFLGFLLPTMAGGLLTWSLTGGMLGLLWGGFVRVFLTTQFSYMLNSLCHVPVFGRRKLSTPGSDNSHDSLLLVIPTFGQGYHNRHHAFPKVAVLGAHWWHFDLGGWILNAFEAIGWVSNVRRLAPGWREGSAALIDSEAEAM